jgi:multidrug resistance efflux pump
LAKETGNTAAEEEIAFWQATIAFGEHNFAAAESSLRGVVSEFRRGHDNPGLLSSTAFLVNTLLYEQKIEDAQKQLAEVQEVAAKARYFEESQQLRIAEDRCKAATGKTAEAKRDLESTATLVANKGYPLVALEARLAVAEIEIKSGAISAGKAHLAAIERDAKKSGFNFVAREVAFVRG